jgi:hypothetical protein
MMRIVTESEFFLYYIYYLIKEALRVVYLERQIL